MVDGPHLEALLQVVWRLVRLCGEVPTRRSEYDEQQAIQVKSKERSPPICIVMFFAETLLGQLHLLLLGKHEEPRRQIKHVLTAETERVVCQISKPCGGKRCRKSGQPERSGHLQMGRHQP